MTVAIPKSGSTILRVSGKDVRLTNLDKLFWPELTISKRDLVQYYADVGTTRGTSSTFP